METPIETIIAKRLRDNYNAISKLPYMEQKPEEALAQTIHNHLNLGTGNGHFQIQHEKGSSQWLVYVSIQIDKKFFNLGSFTLSNFDDSTQDTTIEFSNELIRQMLCQPCSFARINLLSLNRENLPLGFRRLQFMQSYLRTKWALDNVLYDGIEVKEYEKIQQLTHFTHSQDDKIFNREDFKYLNHKANHWLRNPVVAGLVGTLFVIAVIALVMSPLIAVDTVGAAVNARELLFILSLIAELVVGWQLGKHFVPKMIAYPREAEHAERALIELENLVATYNLIPEDKRGLFIQDAKELTVDKPISTFPFCTGSGFFWHSVSGSVPQNEPFVIPKPPSPYSETNPNPIPTVTKTS